MVETISPVVHGDDRSLYRLSVVLHVLGAGASAAAFGALLGGLGAVAGAPWGRRGAIALAIVALLYAAREAFALPIPLPQRRRQVPEWWRTFYSPPVASLLYGLGLGVGFLTYVTFGTLVAVAAGAFLSGDPLTGALVMAPFGLARGIAAPLAARRSPDAAIDRLEELSETRSPRVVNALALAVVGAAALAFLV